METIILLLLTTSISNSELRVTQPSEKIQAQLQEWEGKTTGCWISAVRSLRDGCNEGQILREDDRKKLAFMFASCQLQEDGIEPQKDPVEMALKAKDGYPLVYQIYTEYLVNVEVVCNTLSQRIFQKETRNAMEALKDASVTHLKELQAMKTSMSNIKEMANIIKSELESNQIQMSDNFLKLLLEQDKLSSEFDRHSDEMSQEFDHVGKHISQSHQRLSHLQDQTANVSVMLMSVETSASAIRQNQDIFHYYWSTADDMLNVLNQSVSSIATLIFITSTCVLSYILTSPVRTRSARFPMMLSCILCYLTESLISSYAIHVTPVARLEMIWLIRKSYVILALGCLLYFAVKYVEPEVQIVRRLNEFEGRFFERIKNELRDRVRSISRAPSRRKPVSRLPSVAADDDEIHSEVASVRSEVASVRSKSLKERSVSPTRAESPEVVHPQVSVKEERTPPTLPLTWTPTTYSSNYSSYRRGLKEETTRLSESVETVRSAQSSCSRTRYASASPAAFEEFDRMLLVCSEVGSVDF